MMDLAEHIPDSWKTPLQPGLGLADVERLQAFLAAERAAHRIFPPEADVFRALALTPFESASVVILGQDPYHDDGQAHGLAFSVRPGIKPPPSLVNIFKELQTDLGLSRPASGCLEPWAGQGVLLLNTVLTVRAHEPASHQNQGWEPFTDAIIRAIKARGTPAIFVLWGAQAAKKLALINGDNVDLARHVIIRSAHPSPLSARHGFFGSKPFSRINAALANMGKAPIDWRLDS